MKMNRMILWKILKENDLPDITDAEGSVLEFQEETCDVPSTEMVTKYPDLHQYVLSKRTR